MTSKWLLIAEMTHDNGAIVGSIQKEYVDYDEAVKMMQSLVDVSNLMGTKLNSMLNPVSEPIKVLMDQRLTRDRRRSTRREGMTRRSKPRRILSGRRSIAADRRRG